ncbi:hypothetical protein WDZ17_15010 [Pseudokineococcus basanitobsidens]|uniref:Uncharacterized protein n=1 Tax=Pseudokineococcus basanitobsidens TaxID=1926649 RepID=A0ABU8RNQ2_9ACTN
MAKHVRKTWVALAATASLVAGGAVSASAADVPVRSLDAAEAAAEGGIRATDAPRAIRVGAPEQTIPVTVITDEPVDLVDAGVVRDLEEDDPYLVAYGFTEDAEPNRPTVYKVGADIFAEDIEAWGPHTWVLGGYDVDENAEEVTVVAAGTVETEVKAHSILGLSARRVGDQVRVTGSARGYHSVEERYVPLSGRTVSVQAYTGTAWKQVTGATTDARGNLTTFVPGIPQGTRMRLVLTDAATVWGAVSSYRGV